MRSYGQHCPVAHALDVIGERWALLVLRELRLGPRRYTDLAAALPGLGPSVLSQRLRELEAAGVLTRRTLPAPASAAVYALTPWGAELEPVFGALARWGAASPTPLTGAVSADAALLGLRTFHRGTDPPWDGVVEIRIGREVYTVRGPGRAHDVPAPDVPAPDVPALHVRRGEPAPHPDAVLTGSAEAVQAVTTGGRPLDDALTAGDLTLHGDRDVVRALLGGGPPGG